MRYQTIRNLKNTLFFGVFVTLCSMLFSMIQEGRALGFLSGALDGVLIAFPLAFYTFQVANGWLLPLMRRLNFVATLFINSSIYVLFILLGRATGTWLRDDVFNLFPGFQDQAFLQAFIFAVVISVLLNILVQVGRITGNRVLLNFISGSYHQPREEYRLMMFMDLVSSTSIAEEIGNLKFLSLLDTLFSDMTESILKSGAEIYKYVGDEIILSWKQPTSQNAVAFFFDFQRYLELRSTFYQKQFSCRPEFRAGMHAGMVVTGEMGELKKEIVFLGDVLNTTARIAGMCKKLNHSLLLSAEVQKSIDVDRSYDLEDLGEYALRGKSEQVHLFGAIQKSPPGKHSLEAV